MSSGGEDSLSRAEELLARLEAARTELEQLSELAKAVEEELDRAKRAAEADAAQS